ncbi:translesion error-prone DNA polymerase V autoproteolytic subunit [Marinospirillum sp.]|uniref:translesion error-prone DNA polymerase V autoproteolytic subunit n=1 Tax=Marinospirillum sp. TaxID=2183934 RepID=UPI003A84EB5C
MVASIELMGAAEVNTHLAIPLYQDAVSAGFPSPAQEDVERTLDLNTLCIQHPAATFFARAQGESMIEAGIFAGDILVVDRALTARHGDIVIARLFGELTVKELALHPCLRLLPRHAGWPEIPISDGTDLEILGVVTFVLHSLRRPG